MSVRHSVRLALATCAHLPGVHPDDVHLAASLSRLGIEPGACVWSDPSIDWSSFDAVLIRTTWDYFQRYEEFLSWLDRPLRCWRAPASHWKPWLRSATPTTPTRASTAW
jgi:hypothetical protein